ncbi:ABC transporter permease [Ruminococcus sp.]|uniref:ABC transporter permease n=1 Tax=Ruminococcus sp. TaxID=41978 RepID=UPI0025D42B01|nr:ABC transporter permease [Ruminococcus sp.]MBQ8967543.1 ABC transporter permease [Ruminococcus sp.]
MKLRELPLIDIRRRPLRSTALIVVAAILSAAVFGGQVVIRSLQRGLDSLKQRLGADIIVLPEGAENKVDLENILLQGTPGYFYMDKSAAEEIASIDGVDKLSAQYFLVSANAECCTVQVQIIGFDEQSDITVKPWLKEAYEGSLGKNEIIVGAGLATKVGHSLTLYGVECRAVGKLERTGTGLDTAVYATNETVRGLIKASAEQGIAVLSRQSPEDVVSSVYIKAAEGTDLDELTAAINTEVEGVQAVRTKSMMTETADRLGVISKGIAVFIAAVWVLAVIIMSAVFYLTANERKREFAVLRVMGFSRKKLSRLVLTEALITAGAGAAAGVILTSAAVLPFVNIIEQKTALPLLMPKTSAIVSAGAAVIITVLATGSAAAALSAYRLSHIDTGKILREGC